MSRCRSCGWEGSHQNNCPLENAPDNCPECQWASGQHSAHCTGARLDVKVKQPVPAVSPSGQSRVDHYDRGGPEPISVIRAWSLNFALGNVIKYVRRAGHKVPTGYSPECAALEDLKKARNYLDDEIRALEARIDGSCP